MHATRRVGGPRREATERVRLRRDSTQISGWTLNISRGGARLVLEDPVELGGFYQVELGESPEAREVKIVWIQDETDGQIVGIQFLDTDGSVPPPAIAPSVTPAAPIAPGPASLPKKA